MSAIEGWQFFEAALGKHYVGWDFGTVRDQIIEGRKANPRFGLSTDPVAVGNELDERNAIRMLGIRGGETYVDTSGADDPKHRPLLFPDSSPSVAAGANRILGGAKIALEMFGEQGPVHRDVATKRAAICVDCPKNDKGDWTRFFTIPAAGLIRRMLGVVNEMRLETPSDKDLIFCTACSCPLRTKVWAPLQHILKHTPPESMAQLDPRCWITAEQKEHQ